MTSAATIIDKGSSVNLRSPKIFLLWGSFFTLSIAAIGLLLVIFAPERRLGATPAYYVGLVFHLAFLLTGILLLKKTYNFPVLLHPVVTFSGVFIGTIMIPATIAVIANPTEPFGLINLRINYDLTGASMAIQLLAHVCMWFGYIVSLNKSYVGFKEGILPKYYEKVLIIWLTAVVLYLIGGTLLRYGATETSSINQILVVGVSANKMILIIALFQVSRRLWPRWLAGLFLITELAIAAFSGFTWSFVTLFIVLALGLYATKFVTNKRIILLGFFTVVVLAVVVLPFQESRRTAYRRDGSIKDIVTLMQSPDRFGDVDRSELLKMKTYYRQGGIVFTPNIILQEIPSRFPYRGFGELLMFPLNIIPRFLWPDKPILSYGTWINTEIVGNPDTGSSMSASLIGDPYLYAGWLGVIILYIIWGLCLAQLFRFCVGKPSLLLGLSTFYFSVDTLTVSMLGLFQSFIVFSLLYYWLGTNNGRFYQPK